MCEPESEFDRQRFGKTEARRLVIIGVSVTLLLSFAIIICIFVDCNKRDHVIAKTAVEVRIPEYFLPYADAIRNADCKIVENAWRMNSASGVTVTNLCGFFLLPLRKKVACRQVRVPGDPRTYRNGIHQGIDFYETSSGEPVHAAAPGVVIRIDKDYVPVGRESRDEMLKLCRTKWGGTPGSVGMPRAEEPYGNVLDKLSGRQVILYHGKNSSNDPVISLYAHLSGVNRQLSPGDPVSPDTVIGYVGNSGTSGEVNNDQTENHLHMELFVGGMYWSPKREEEIGKKQPGGRYAELQAAVLDELSGGNSVAPH